MTLVRLDQSAIASPSTSRPRGLRVLEMVVGCLSSRSYPLLGPMCIWQPYPPPTRRNVGAEVEQRRD